MIKINSVQQLLMVLEQKDIKIWVENAQLKFSAPKNVFTNELKQLVRDNKADIIRHLSNQSTQVIKNLYALSPMQAGMLFHSQLAPNSSTYIEQTLLHMHDATFELPRFVMAMQHVIDRHDGLRATFQAEGLSKVQVIEPQAPLPVTYVDWRAYSAEEQQARLSQLIEQDRLTDFDFSQAPLLRFMVIQNDEHRYDLLFTFHHILMDRWSVDLFWSEVLRAYAGQPLPKATPYQSYIHYVRQQPAEPAFWQNYLSGFYAPTPLPAAATIDTQAPSKMDSVSETFSLDATLNLTRFVRTQGLTINTVFQAAWALLLARYVRESDVLFGMVTSGRAAPIRGIESIVGLFINTLPFRVQLDPSLTGSDLLQQIARTQLDLQQREHTSLVDVQQWSDMPAGTPLFDSLFVFQNTPQSAERTVNELDCHPGWVEPGDTGYPLVALVVPGEAATLVVSYDSARYDEHTAERLLTHWKQLVMGMVSHPEQPVLQLPMLTDAEYQQIVHEFNHKTGDFGDSLASPPLGQTIHGLFERQVERSPDAIALIFAGTTLTYAELNARANQLAHELISLGVQADTLVAIAMERSLEMVVSLLAVLKAGGAYVPIDPTYPSERIAFMLHDCGAQIILTQPDFLSQLPEYGGHYLFVEGRQAQGAQHAQYPSTNPTTETNPNHLAYVIYTSGSTGQPKGVLISHKNVWRLFAATDKWFNFDATDVWTLFHSFAFDFSVWELWGALFYGGRLVVVSYHVSRDPHAFYKLLCEQGVTVLNQTPSAFRQLMNVVVDREAHALRYVIFGGEALEFESLRPWFALHGDRTPQLVNMYGITETTVHVTYQPIKATDLDRHRGSSRIGQAIPDLELYILDTYASPVPVGVSGELHVGGAGLARGYLNRPELTAERFIEHPKFGRLYKTGDLASWVLEEEGRFNISYIGRTDFQVKIRGFRIELGEIEAVLSQHLGVQEAVVSAREEQGDQRLAAYIVPSQENAYPVRQLMRFEQEGLLNAQTHYILPNGMVVFYQNRSETDFMYREIFTETSYLRHGITLTDGCCVFDVGANIGIFSLFVHQQCQNPTIYTFEPIPPIFELLDLNTALYGIDAQNFDYGLASVSGSHTFTYYPHVSVVSGRFADDSEEQAVIKSFLMNESTGDISDTALNEMLATRLQSEQINCEFKTLSQVIAEQNVSQIDLLKIDVEKSEYDILLGISEKDWPKIKQVILEVHDKQGELAAIQNLLEKQGFICTIEQESMLENTGLYNLYAIHPSARPSSNSENGLFGHSYNNTADLIQDVKAHLSEQLPDYMIPSAIVPLSVMPLTANGKLDRRALPAPDYADIQTTFVAPRNALEMQLADIWANVLGVQQVGIYDNFFALGGHSLLATQVISRVRMQLNLEVPLKMLFEASDLSTFAQSISQTQESSTSIIERVARDGQLPLSFAQQRLWFLDQMGSGTAYNIPMALNLRGSLNVTILQQTLQEIVRRHESLRTTFAVDDGTPYQIIHPEMTINLPLINLSAYAKRADEQAREVKRLTHVEATHPFDLSSDPMIRAKLLKLSDIGLNDTSTTHHILLLTMHHIASDGWSMGVLVREMAALYEAFSFGQSSPLPDLPIQYADFAVWQRNYLQGEVFQKQLGYWTERLANAPELLQLPTDRARPAQQSFQGDVVSLELDAHLTRQLRALSQRQGTTLYMTLLAAFQILMSRYSGQTDMVIGSPIANRNRQEIEPLIGFFVNTLALRADLAGDDSSEALSFLDVLTQAQETTEAAYDHQDIPFERLVEELRPERNLNHNPLVQVVFALQNAPMGTFELPGLNVTPAEDSVQTTRFDIEMHFAEVEDYLQGYCVYSTDLFDKTTIERMVGHFQTLLAGIVKNPRHSIAELPLLTEAERHQLLVEWNDTTTDYPFDASIHHLFEQQVERTPDAIALVFKDQTLTYRELNQRANQLAHYLISEGVGPEVRVGICVERSIEMVVGLLAILKAGGAYVPLDPSYPQERLAFMLSDSHILLLLTQEKLLGSLPEGPTTRCLDTLDLEGRPQENILSRNVTAENLAYIMYTSGSTGRPKGVSVIHKNVVRLVKETNFIEFSTSDVFLQLAPISFDAATLEIWGPMLNGGQLVIMPPANPSLSELARAIERYNVSTLWLSAGLFHLMVDEQLEALHSLRWLLAGGDVLSVPHVHRAVKALPNCQVINGYGPTENTTFTCCHPIHTVSPNERSIPIGRPIANTQVYILDNQLQPVPIGVSGELYTGGDGVARGYHNNEKLTQERFIENPFAASPHSPHSGQSRLYRTGDVARWLPNGEIEFFGRMDTQVKLRGFRIELGEIETALTLHPTIQDAVVVAREDGNALSANNKQLVSYLVAGQIDSETQTEHVEQWQNLYEQTYGQAPQQEDLAFNLLGWNSSYTGQPIPEIEMAEWVEGTIADIRRLQPKRILEIGCGTGLLLSQLAPDCDLYWGTDYSQQAIEHVERLKAATPDLGHVYLNQRLADDFTGISQHQFDCVILNSIVQYFPSAEYLLTVLEGAVQAVRPGGKIYVGDVRNLRLLSAYHAAVQTYQAADDLPLTELQTRIQQRLRDEEELLIDPDFFYALQKHLPGITQVEIQLKRGQYVNELTQFRYQVVLHVEKVERQQVDSEQISWLEEDWPQQEWSVSTLESRLHNLIETHPERALLIRNIPNGRVQDAVQTLEILERINGQPSAKQSKIETVGQLRHHDSVAQHVHPESLWAFSETLPVRVVVTWSRSPGLMDAFFVPTTQRSMPHSLPLPAQQAERMKKAWSAYANNPLLGALNRTLVPKVRTWLAEKLPDYMVPSAFVMLDALPLTPNGKVDRKALPAPLSLYRIDEDTFVSPSTSTQISLATMWSEVLGIEQLSVWDDFFEIGGHSLMATQVVSRIKSHFQINMPVRSVFENPTIAELAEHIEILLEAKQMTMQNEQLGQDEEVEIEEW